MDILVTYSLLDLIKQKNSNLKSIIEIFQELAENLLVDYKINKKYKIKKLKNDFDKKYSISIPYPTLLIMLKRIRQENPKNFSLFYDDYEFKFNDICFNSLRNEIEIEKEKINNLRETYSKLCNAQNIEKKLDLDIFISSYHKELISYLNGRDFEPQNYNRCEEFKILKTLLQFEHYKNIIEKLVSGSIISAYLSLEYVKNIAKKTLLLDTNFIISLFDLHSDESYITCKEIIIIAKKFKFKIVVLPETIKEVKNLLIRKSKIKSIDLFIAQDRHTIEHGMLRRHLHPSNLVLYSNKIEKLLRNEGIILLSRSLNNHLFENVMNTEIYQKLKDRPFNPEGVKHDAMAMNYIKKLRKLNEIGFKETSAFFVTDSRGYLDNKISAKTNLPYLIKTDELLNILWLMDPTSISSISKIKISETFSLYLDRKLPNRKMLKKLDQKMRSFKNLPICLNDCVDIAVNISVLDSKDLEELYNIKEEREIKNKISELAIKARNKKTEEFKKIKENMDKVIDIFIGNYNNEKRQSEEKINEIKKIKKDNEYQTLIIKKDSLKKLIERDEEEKNNIQAQIEVYHDSIEKTKRVIAFISLGIIISVIIYFGLILIIPQWVIIEPISFIINLIFPVIYLILSVFNKTINPIKIFNNISNRLQKNKIKKTVELENRYKLISVRIANNMCEVKNIIL